MKAIAIGAAAALLAACATAEEESNAALPSPFGPEDRLGAVNHLSAEKTAAAAALVQEGRTFALGMVTGPATPAWGPREYDVTVLQLDDGTGAPLGAAGAVSNDDLVRTFVGIGSQIDGLGHFGIDHVYYNNVPAADVVSPTGLLQYGTHELPPMATRGVLLDMTKHFGVDPVPDGTPFNRAEIDAAAEAAGVTIERGDVVIFHTGKMEAVADLPELSPTQPGLGVEGAQYLSDLGVVAVGADTFALEVIPFENPANVFEVHGKLLVENGVYILENMVTAELAEHGDGEFFFVLGVPRLEGTVQAIINPVAIR
ncbi:MAG: cyclase family protein [Pseudomonadota bacterium]